MTLMLAVADGFRRLLVPLVLGSGVLLLALLATLVVQRTVRASLDRGRARLAALYRPLIDQVLFDEEVPADLVRRLVDAPVGHRRGQAMLLLAAVRTLAGPPILRARSLAQDLDLLGLWRRDVREPRWWRRAEAVRALGAVREPSAYGEIVEALDDPNEEVRAAAVEALGRLGDTRAVPELLQRLPAQSRHQQVRIVGALRALGQGGGPEVLDYARRHPEQLPLMADLLALVAGSSAFDDLLQWAGDPRPDIRAAALSALGTIGLDDRGYYFALRALTDPAPGVRAMAARALGRARRTDAAPYLSAALDDAWDVAAYSARGLAGLAGAGRAVLDERSRDGGQAGELARQILWQMDAGGARRVDPRPPARTDG